MPKSNNKPLRVQAAQMEVMPGNPPANLEKMLALFKDAERDHAHIVVFPEMAFSGAMPGSAWENESFLRECEDCAEELRKATKGSQTAAIFGNVAIDWHKQGTDGQVRKFNACFAASEGKWVAPEGARHAFAIKARFSSRPGIVEGRHFFDIFRLAHELGTSPSRLLAPFKIKGARLACVIGPDDLGDACGFSPLTAMRAGSADAIIVLASEPFALGRLQHLQKTLSRAARTHGLPLCFVNNIGIQNCSKTIFSFNGASCVLAADGQPSQTAPNFQEATLNFDVLPGSLPRQNIDSTRAQTGDDIAWLYNALVFGAGRFMKQSGITRVVIGASGGIDSSVAAALFRRLLPPENLILVNMPSRHNSPTTIQLARDMASRLGCLYAEIPIDESTALTARQINRLAISSADGSLRQTLHLTEAIMENVQARDRSGRVLAAMAAAFNGVFTCNSNKAEMTIGYATLYGDLGGFLAPLADLWKGEVYAMGRHLNNSVFECPPIPEACFSIKPSAELSPAQNIDEGKGDPLFYPYHDKLFASWIEAEPPATPEDNLQWQIKGKLEKKIGYDGRIQDLFPEPGAFLEDLDRWWKLYRGLSVNKRVQSPPVLAMKRRPFGCAIPESIMQPRLSHKYARLRNKISSTSFASSSGDR